MEWVAEAVRSSDVAAMSLLICSYHTPAYTLVDEGRYVYLLPKPTGYYAGQGYRHCVNGREPDLSDSVQHEDLSPGELFYYESTSGMLCFSWEVSDQVRLEARPEHELEGKTYTLSYALKVDDLLGGQDSFNYVDAFMRAARASGSRVIER